jgi:uncharacterized protein YfiM (DUF2279 family)
LLLPAAAALLLHSAGSSATTAVTVWRQCHSVQRLVHVASYVAGTQVTLQQKCRSSSKGTSRMQLSMRLAQLAGADCCGLASMLAR